MNSRWDISSRFLAGVHDILGKEYENVDTWFIECGVDLDALESRAKRTSWRSTRIALGRIYDELGSDEKVVELGEQLVSTRPFVPAGVVLHNLDRTLDALRAVSTWLGPVIFPMVQRRFQTPSNDQMTLDMSFVEGVKPCREALLVEAGLLRSTLEDADTLTYDCSGTQLSARIHIHQPRDREKGIESRLSRAAIFELIDQQQLTADRILSCAEENRNSSSDNAAAHQKQQPYELAFEISQTGFWNWDLNAETMTFSEPWLEFLGYDPDTLGTHPT